LADISELKTYAFRPKEIHTFNFPSVESVDFDAKTFAFPL